MKCVTCAKNETANGKGVCDKCLDIPPEPPARKRPPLCLKCDRPFVPRSKVNYLCEPCAAENARIGISIRPDPFTGRRRHLTES